MRTFILPAAASLLLSAGAACAQPSTATIFGVPRPAQEFSTSVTSGTFATSDGGTIFGVPRATLQAPPSAFAAMPAPGLIEESMDRHLLPRGAGVAHRG